MLTGEFTPTAAATVVLQSPPEEAAAEVFLPPTDLYPKMFPAICVAEVCTDGIDAANAIPAYKPDGGRRYTPAEINRIWRGFVKSRNGVYTDDQVKYVSERLFQFPTHIPRVRKRIDGETVGEHCIRVMRSSVHMANANTHSQIGVDKPVMQAGGRFAIEDPEEGVQKKDEQEEIALDFNWDKWPTFLGAVAVMGEWGLERTHDGLSNYNQQADKLNGCLPNVNRWWGATRAHATVVQRIARLYATRLHPSRGETDPAKVAALEAARAQTLIEQLPLLEKHLAFWDDGADDPAKLGLEPGSAYRRVVRMPNGKIMYRNWDDGDGPRPEMYLQDLKTLAKLEGSLGRPATEAEKTLLFKSLRASAEDAEDFKVSKARDHKNLYTLHTIEFVPIKQNGLMYEYLCTLAYGYRAKAAAATDPIEKASALERAELYEQRAQDLAECIHEYCLTDDGFCADHDFVTGKTEPGYDLAGVYALGSGVFSWDRGRAMLDVLDKRFYRKGGLINTLYESDEQWDNNAWPISQLEAVCAGMLYGRYDLAYKWAKTWIKANDRLFKRLGILPEKSDPNNLGFAGDHGEYDCVEDLLMTLGTDMFLRDMLPYLKRKAKEQAAREQAQAVGAAALSR